MCRLNFYTPVLLLFCGAGLFAQIRTPKVTKNSSLIRFTENKNQWDERVQYRAQLDGGALWVEKDALTYSFYDKETYRELHANYKAKPVKSIRTTGFKVKFTGSNPNTTIQSNRATPDYTNYFIGKDPSKWAGNVKNYKRILYQDLWSGIDLEALGQDNSVKYNFYVKPGADAGDIKMFYDKVKQISLVNDEILITTTLNELVEHKPYAYQLIDGKKVEVPCKFKLKDNTVSFSFPKGYKHKYELVIDPVLVFACSSGSFADNFGMTATYDDHGNLYSGGTCFDQGFPVVNAYDSTFNGVTAYGRTDVVITKYDSSGTYLHYSTYIGGGQSSEIVTSLIIDHQDNLYLYGATGSSDFPTSNGCFDNTFNGGDTLTFVFNGTYFYKGTDIYIAKLSPGGNQLLASTFIGGSRNDGVNCNLITTYIIGSYTLTESKADSLQYNYGDQYRGEIQLDKNDDPVICSSSRSPDFPTKNPIDNSLGGLQDAVVFKFNQSLSALKWSTYIGGSNNDAGYALVIGKNNETYTTGGTRSNDFPTTSGVLSPAFNGGKCDGYITKIDATGTSILAATYIGTSDYDQSYFIQLDKYQDVYVYGQSLGNMPVISSAYSNANGKQFISKLSTNLSAYIYSTVFGNGNGQVNISPAAFSIDYCENVYLSGWGGNIIYGPQTFGLPVTDTLTPNIDGYNFYVMSLDKNCNNLLYASFFGGAQSPEHVDGGTSRFDKRGIIYQSVCAGCRGNDDFPVTPGAWPTALYGTDINQSDSLPAFFPDGGCNNGTFKIDFNIPLVTANYAANTSGCAPLTVNFANLSNNYNSYFWDFGNNDTTSSIKNPTHVYTTPGTYTVMLIVKNPATCNMSDTTFININVYPQVTSNFNYTKNNCGSTFNFTDSSYTVVNSWNWNFGDGNTSTQQNPTHIYASPGTYTVTLAGNNQYGCPDTIKKVVSFSGFAPLSVSPNQTICRDSTAQLNASGGIAYQWVPPAGLNNASISNPVASPTATTSYTVFITQTNGTDTCTYNLSTNITVSAYTPSQLSAYASPDTLFAGQSSQLGTFTNGGSVVWGPNYNISDIHSSSPVVTPEHTTTYTVTYTNNYGCVFPLAGVTIYVITKDCNESTVFVPNTFTPNSDGVNDIMYARSNMLTQVEFRIYDRWGQEVFYTNDITKGWDGIFNSKPCNPDVFGYYIKYKCNNGKDSFKKGNITLIR